MEDAAARKRKLQQMRQLANGEKMEMDSSNSCSSSSRSSNNEPQQIVYDSKKIKFRNYQPHDASLNVPVTVELLLQPIQESQKNNIVDILKSELEQTREVEVNIIPRKSNWDLKEQVAGKLDKLKRRTQRAIVDILKEKIAAEGNELD